MLIDFSAIDARKAYFWMSSTITPRPVAWVSTRSKTGVANLAPFSFFQMVTASPPTLMLSPMLHQNGSIKDTTRNIMENGEFVVNLVPFPLVDAMNATSFSYEADVSEIDRCSVATLPSERVRPPRIAGVPVSFECKLASIQAYPEQHPSCHIVLGEVLFAHVDETILDEHGQVDPARLDVVSRMGANWYGRTQTADNFTLHRPEGWARPAPKSSGAD
jgi:flavin reductase (DIM6/NTAB) family NADH-FMN oxidoreductase RutF